MNGLNNLCNASYSIILYMSGFLDQIVAFSLTIVPACHCFLCSLAVFTSSMLCFQRATKYYYNYYMNRKEEVTWLVTLQSACQLKGCMHAYICETNLFYKGNMEKNMVFRILLMINVQGAVFELAHCLTRRDHREQAACLPVETLLCVWLPWFSSVYFAPLSLPPFLPFALSFTALLQATLDVVMNLQFHYIEKLWQTFWYSTSPSSDGNTTIPNRSDHTYSTRRTNAEMKGRNKLPYSIYSLRKSTYYIFNSMSSHK